MNSDESTLYDRGLTVRKDVLGAEHVTAAIERGNEFEAEFQQLVTEYCWGICWTDERLTRQTRSVLNLGMTAAGGRMEEFELHFRGALRNGLTEAELKAVLIQIAVYCGIPAGVSCFRIAGRVLAEQLNDADQGPPNGRGPIRSTGTTPAADSPST